MKNQILLLLLILSVLFNSLNVYAYDIKSGKDELQIDYVKALEDGCKKIKVKKPVLAGTLGLLPGGGSFYTGRKGLGVLDIFLYPISVLWEVPSSASRASDRNKIATIEACQNKGI